MNKGRMVFSFFGSSSSLFLSFRNKKNGFFLSFRLIVFGFFWQFKFSHSELVPHFFSSLSRCGSSHQQTRLPRFQIKRHQTSINLRLFLIRQHQRRICICKRNRRTLEKKEFSSFQQNKQSSISSSLFFVTFAISRLSIAAQSASRQLFSHLTKNSSSCCCAHVMQ
jgi:hypothetical protein